jgi:protein translocase SecG subunit
LKEIEDMLKLIGFFVSILLIVIIFLRVPQENVGLSSFATKSDLLGSPSSAERFLNILTAVGIFIYFSLALKLNLMS